MKTRVMLIVFMAILSVNVWGQTSKERLEQLFISCTDVLDNDVNGSWMTPKEMKEFVEIFAKGKLIEKEGSTYTFKTDSLLPTEVKIVCMFTDSIPTSIAIGCKPGDNFLLCMYQIEEAMKKSNYVDRICGKRFRLVDSSDGNGFMIRKSEGTRDSGRKITRIYTAVPIMNTIAVIFSNQ